LLTLLFIPHVIINSVTIKRFPESWQEFAMTKLSAIFAAAVLAATSFSTLAATQVDESQSQNLQQMGTVSVSGVHGSFDDATARLAQKAEQMGAGHYRIIRTETPGDSSLWSGNAEIYR